MTGESSIQRAQQPERITFEHRHHAEHLVGRIRDHRSRSSRLERVLGPQASTSAPRAAVVREMPHSARPAPVRPPGARAARAKDPTGAALGRLPGRSAIRQWIFLEPGFRRWRRQGHHRWRWRVHALSPDGPLAALLSDRRDFVRPLLRSAIMDKVLFSCSADQLRSAIRRLGSAGTTSGRGLPSLAGRRQKPSRGIATGGFDTARVWLAEQSRSPCTPDRHQISAVSMCQPTSTVLPSPTSGPGKGAAAKRKAPGGDFDKAELDHAPRPSSIKAAVHQEADTEAAAHYAASFGNSP